MPAYLLALVAHEEVVRGRSAEHEPPLGLDGFGWALSDHAAIGRAIVHSGLSTVLGPRAGYGRC